MKIYLFAIVLIFCIVGVVEADVDPQFAIDLLTGETAASTTPCSGPPGSGCENIVPQMSVARREEIQVQQPERYITPANPIEYARQQIPRYSQYPAWGYQIPVPRYPIYRDTRALEVAVLYGGRQTSSYWQRKWEIEAMEAKHRAAAKYEAEVARRLEKEEEEVLSETLPDKSIITLQADVQVAPDPPVSRDKDHAFILPPWFYGVLGWVIFGSITTFFTFWGMKILLRT